MKSTLDHIAPYLGPRRSLHRIIIAGGVVVAAATALGLFDPPDWLLPSILHDIP
jgi:hypothetical protein